MIQPTKCLNKCKLLFCKSKSQEFWNIELLDQWLSIIRACYLFVVSKYLTVPNKQYTWTRKLQTNYMLIPKEHFLQHCSSLHLYNVICCVFLAGFNRWVLLCVLVFTIFLCHLHKMDCELNQTNNVTVDTIAGIMLHLK